MSSVSAHTAAIVALIKQGHYVACPDTGTVTSVKTGKVQGIKKPGAKAPYCVINCTCPVTKNRYSASLHRVLWVYFRGDIPHGMQVNHKNAERWDNRIENLELNTPAQNTVNAVKDGRMQQKLGMEGALELRKAFLAEETVSKNELTRRFKISEPMVTRILKNTGYPGIDELSLRCVAEHAKRYPVRAVKPVSEAQLAVLALIKAGAISVDPEKAEFVGVTTTVKLYPVMESRPYPALSVKLGKANHVTVPAHRMMWLAFNGIPAKGLVIHHKNSNKADFRLANLELVTPKENSRHAAAIGTLGHSKVDEELATELRKSFVANPRSANKLSEEYGISQRTVRTMLLDVTHTYGAVELREAARAAYVEMTDKWRAGGRTEGGTLSLKVKKAAPSPALL